MTPGGIPRAAPTSTIDAIHERDVRVAKDHPMTPVRRRIDWPPTRAGSRERPRTSSADQRRRGQGQRQREAVSSFARGSGYEFVDEYYDAAVSGAEPGRRPARLCRGSPPTAVLIRQVLGAVSQFEKAALDP
jgi:hypothetical protein